MLQASRATWRCRHRGEGATLRNARDPCMGGSAPGTPRGPETAPQLGPSRTSDQPNHEQDPFPFLLQIRLGKRGLALPRLYLWPFSHPVACSLLICISESSLADSSLVFNWYVNITGHTTENGRPGTGFKSGGTAFKKGPERNRLKGQVCPQTEVFSHELGKPSA